MPLKCSHTGCASFDLAENDELAFYQDLNTGGWNLALGPEFIIPETTLPPHIRLVDTGDLRFPYNAVCAKCLAKIGKVNAICGFERVTINFSGKKVGLVHSSYERVPSGTQKWSKVMTMFPQIRTITATIRDNALIVGSDTINFHSVNDLDDMINAGNAVSKRSRLYPRNYQWRSFFFSCYNNVLLCLPTGMGKTLIATMLMKAYHRRNPKKSQTFIVPTVVLVEQQAVVIERNTGMKVVRRSGEQNKTPWSPSEICVCTPAMLLNGIKLNEVDMSQQSLLVFDEVHEANSPLSPYGLLLPYLTKCSDSQRPRILGLTASPSSSNAFDIRQSILSLCDKLGAVPYTPLAHDNTDKAKTINCTYVAIHKSPFEMRYEKFVIDSLEKLSSFHEFFGSNWKAVPTYVQTQIKIDIIVKTLSHSKIVAQNMADMSLFELTQWMKKWIDSLELLQIFGPRKLIEFIQADLEFAETNDSLRRISPQLVLFVAQMRLTFEQIISEYCVADHSPKVEELLRRLNYHHNDQERILVFVNRRNTAERLCRKLKDDPDVSKMNPTYIVGNAGSNFPKELQHEILDKFSKGECRVLISTSVLEQGIDVATCGLVICFDGVKSVKSTIQSRGRARKDAANFVAFVISEEQRKANELSQMEISMDYAIRQLMLEYRSSFEGHVNEEIEKFLDSDRQTGDANENSDIEIDDEDDVEDDVEDLGVSSDKQFIHLRFFNFVNSHTAVDSLVNLIGNCFLSPFDRVNVKKGFINAYFAVNDVESGSKIIKEISSIPNQKIYRKFSRLRTWIELSHNIVKTEEPDEDNAFTEGLDFDLLRGFYFKDCLTVNYNSNHIWNGKFKLIIRNNEVLLSTPSEQFSIRSIDFDDPVLINDSDSCFEMFLCLRIPPSYIVGNELEHFDFTGTSFNLSIKRFSAVDSKISWRIRNAFKNLNIQVYNVFNLKQASMDDDCGDESSVVKSEDFLINYLIKVWHSTHSAILPTTLPKSILSQFYSCTSTTSLMLLLNNTTPLRFQKLRIQHIADFQLPFPECSSTSDDYALCGRVKVTPYRFMFTGLEPVPKNRVFRYFPDPDNFILISFCDEYGGNPWRSENICEWFLRVLQTGINVGNKYFTFLGCSNSQLREGRCWFSSLDRNVVYNKIGQFPDTWTAGRKLTRIALAFAASFQTVPLDHDRYMKTVAPDVEIGNINFSDGIGRASKVLFKKLTTMLDLPRTTSAFQIRVGGVKGVVSVYDQEDDVTFRKSMKKFESQHNMLEVLNYSRSIPLRLNRHVILLLSSFGVPAEVFLEMQHNMLISNLETLVNDASSFHLVKSHSNIFDWQLLTSDRLIREPFFRHMLFSNVIDLIAGITNYAHIPVPKGRVLMGVMDETETLEYGQVYAYIVEGNNEFELDGKVVVFRNPCVLPSDIRVLNTCNGSSASRLKHLYKNCLVIPSRGPDSHARECAGGDLDGDLYYVIWDKKLIPQSLKVPGEKIVEVFTEEMKTLSINNADENSHKSMTKFFCDYVSKNQLGIIANAHLAVSDKLGMRHPKSVQLARYVAAETDAPKKGLTVGKINPKLLPTTYPDFMQKSDKPSYRSKTVLGELYRQSKPVFEIFLEKRSVTTPQSKFSFIGETKSVERFYELYSFEIKTLLQRFDLQTEVDLFSGTPMWREDYMSTYKQQHQLLTTLMENMRTFWRRWNKIFERWRSEIVNDKQKIFEWYCRPKSSPWPLHSFSFLALPFIDHEECNQKSISQKIHESTKRWVHRNKMQWLSEWRLRFQVGQEIMRKLEGIECHFYGSSMLGLNEEYSDIDLFSADTNFGKLCNMLMCLDKNVMDMKKPHACVSLTVESLNIDVTNFIGGVMKTYGLAAVFDANPGYWSALRVLIEWARTVRIVKSSGSEGIMTVISFCHLFLYFAADSPQLIQSDEKPYTLIRLGNWMESMQNSSCGELVYDFLLHLSKRSSREWLETKTDPLTSEPLVKSDLISELNTNAEYALYILVLHDGDVRKLFQFCTKKRLFRLDKRYIDPKLASEERRKQCLKEIQTMCNPNKAEHLLFELHERNGVFYIEVCGDHQYFPYVEKGLNKIHCRVINTRIRCGIQRYNTFHVRNSTIIIPEFGNGPSTKVSFSTYDGDLFTARHTGFWKSKLTFRNAKRNLNWRTTEYQRYEGQFLEQLRLFKEKRQMNIKHSRVRRFFSDMRCNIRCGNHYLFHVPETLHNSFETISLQRVEQNIANLEEALEIERNENINQDRQNYNSLTLFKGFKMIDDQKPLMLMPLQEMKKKFTEKKSKNTEMISSSANKRMDHIRHSFYPNWSLGLDNARKFAATYGFKEIRPSPDNYYTTISVYWRNRELVIKCDKNGAITEIRHRSTRWLSATIHRSEMIGAGGVDIRTYLECRAILDDDESCIETVVEYMNGRSIYTESFAKQMQKCHASPENEENYESFATRPLIPDIFQLNWRFRSMRLITPVLKFVNAENDTIFLHNIYDGIFHYQKSEFEWFPNHFEFEIRFRTDVVSDEELCRKSYELSLNLFDYAKRLGTLKSRNG